MTTVAFCLLSYRPNHPSGIERSVAALAAGLRELGHRALILAAGSSDRNGRSEPDLVHLRSLRLPRPATNDDVVSALADRSTVEAEVRALLVEHAVDAVCWADALWGLGYLGIRVDGVRTALLAHKIRSDVRWYQALAAADAVCPASHYLYKEAEAAGFEVGPWKVVPNALLAAPKPVLPDARERLRKIGPVRIVSRVEPAKGLAELIAAIPSGWIRPVEMVLAQADFEFWPGMQREVLDDCRRAAKGGPVRILPELGWHDVPPFFGGAAATVIASTQPETFCHAAAEALSVGTPVVAFDHGNVPNLTGGAGRMIPLRSGPGALWTALDALLADRAGYHGACHLAPARVAAHAPSLAAAALLDAVAPRERRR